jgi:pimeloyl-ACP methyl ester carboxylesterase
VAQEDADFHLPSPRAGFRPGPSHWRCMLKGLLEPLPTVAKVCLVPLLSGCGPPVRIETPDRIAQGLVLVLPGVEGKSLYNASVAHGLEDGKVPYAIEVYDWTLGNVLLFPATLRGVERNRREAGKIAERIIAYQGAHPGRPVHIVGHSGGGGQAVFVLEALPPGHEIDSAILMAPAMSPDYDLSRALRRTQAGIWSFYSPYDVGFLAIGTWAFGTMDGRHTPAAGQKGFVLPLALDRQRRQLYLRLHQVRYDPSMAQYGNSGTHIGWANRRFVAAWLAPLINGQRPVESQPAP